jgi:hypothetical protein
MPLSKRTRPTGGRPSIIPFVRRLRLAAEDRHSRVNPSSAPESFLKDCQRSESAGSKSPEPAIAEVVRSNRGDHDCCST